MSNGPHIIYPDNETAELAAFGIGSLNLDEAGELIAKCLWFEGEIKADIPGLEWPSEYSLYDPILKEPLKGQAAHYTGLLAAAIDQGKLKADLIGYQLDGKIITKKSYLKWYVLYEWLEEKDIGLGESVDEYAEFETKLLEKVHELVQEERAKKSLPKKISEKAAPEYGKPYFVLYKKIADLEDENLILKGNAENTKPTSEKQHGAFLNIIGALLGVLLGKSSGGAPYSHFSNQQAVIDMIDTLYGGSNGLSKRNLEDKFSQAKRHLEGQK